MSQEPRIGDNRTTRMKNLDMFESMAKGSKERGATSKGDGAKLLAAFRVDYAEETGSAGHVAPPKDKSPGEAMVALMDKLGARLAFERAGVRLYDALMSKLDGYGAFDGGPSRADLEHIRREEHEHLLMLQQVITDLGGDPAAVTPAANLQATVGRGVQDAITDPRVNLLQSLEALLVAELADDASWEVLCDLVERAGHQDKLGSAFERAYASEEEHVAKVKGWIQAGHQLA